MALYSIFDNLINVWLHVRQLQILLSASALILLWYTVLVEVFEEKSSVADL